MKLFTPLKNKKSRKNQKGQVAIFVALIFQVLFLFFAMVVNVGLLVHHKINLQNSVDLAAYYGAMKQAEMMNVIAHTNYQIRQSWKLLAWRYRVLGTAGVMEATNGAQPVHPYKKSPPPGVLQYSDEVRWEDIAPQVAKFYETPPFCITFIPFKPMPPDESTCKKADMSDVVNLPKTPTNAFFTSITKEAYSITEKGKALAGQRCRIFGSINYGTLGRFIAAYAFDQAQRKMLISALSRNMSKTPEDFLDIDGKSVSEGAKLTLLNNLTDANKVNANFKLYNSLAHSACNNRANNRQVPKWLSEIKISPGFAYKDTYCQKETIQTKTKIISLEELGSQPGSSGESIPNSGPPYHCRADQKNCSVGNQALQDLVFRVFPIIQNFVAVKEEAYPYNASLGFEKDPWCEAYIGVRATASPKIPFSIGSVNLEARAYAKPFGGKIGPWFGKTFPKNTGENAESSKDNVDFEMPSRISDAANLGGGNDLSRIANYRRYPGDAIGLRSAKILGYYSQAIYRMDPHWAAGQVDATNVDGPYNKERYPNFDDWSDIDYNFNERGKNWDILAWDNEGGQRNPMRLLEISTIAPDIYDITNYSIEPNFYEMYGRRIEKSIKDIDGDYLSNYPVRGDLGARADNESGTGYSLTGAPKPFKFFNVKNQVEIAEGLMKSSQLLSPNLVHFEQAKFGHMVLQFNHLLTSWAADNYLDYGFSKVKDNRFGQCPADSVVKEGELPTPGNCLNGGRTGYSVKLVSSDFLLSSQQMPGGEKSGTGQIKNPPPADF